MTRTQSSSPRRLQLPDGGVRGGSGYGWGCPRGITSSMLKSGGVDGPDHETTLRYGAAAARTARVLAAFDKQLSAEYLDSARRAWTWAEVHSKEDDLIYRKTLAFAKELARELRHFRAQAAVELLSYFRANCGDRVTGFEIISRRCLDLLFKHIPKYADPLSGRYDWYLLCELNDTLADSDLDLLVWTTTPWTLPSHSPFKSQTTSPLGSVMVFLEPWLCSVDTKIIKPMKHISIRRFSLPYFAPPLRYNLFGFIEDQ